MASRDNTWTWYFGPSGTEGDVSRRDLLGGKGANLAAMTAIGLPVPPGLTISIEACEAWHARGDRLPAGLIKEVRRQIGRLEGETGKTFGGGTDPLLVSVRSGAAVSMPGMMDTILNLGLTRAAVEALAQLTGNERFALDARRRLLNMFGNVVMEIDHHAFETQFDEVKAGHGAVLDSEVPAAGMRDLCTRYERVYRRHAGHDFPEDPMRQLELSIEAVFRSWNADRAVAYRRINGITGLRGTAVNVQAMVFGNMGDDSGTGVGFTRNPSTGAPVLFGEFLVDAQGEDVVAGIRTPRPLSEMRSWNKAIHAQLLEICATLEAHDRDMQDIEFTIERGRLWMLQTRSGKRTGHAAVRIAVDMVAEGLISRDEALHRVPADDLTQLLLPSFSERDKRRAEVIARGLPASPGAVSGALAFTTEEAVQRAADGESVLLVRRETSPEDVEGMHHAVGILTSTGGMTSHAAVVARGWGKCCVAGAGDLHIDEGRRALSVNGRRLSATDVLSIDGSTGEIMTGAIPRTEPTPTGAFVTLMGWADDVRRLRVRTNADTPADARRGRAFGAEGIGLARTEHMFFEGDRIVAMRRVILSETRDERTRALRKLLPYQRRDFTGILTAMKGLPVTIRLLDPPLHEFLPRDTISLREVAREMDMPVAQVRRRAAQLHEQNPMLGHRGCRLAITFPEILAMQVQAVVEATIACRRKRIDARPEIMIPLVGMRSELARLRALVLETIETVRTATRFRGRLDIPVGTMIEIPRAALTAEEIAEEADFFSFGTNDLTQLAFGFSRDDVGGFLGHYLHGGLLERDPFQTLDTEGVGQLVRLACESGRRCKADLKLGICGEHGGDPDSIDFCEDVGLDYVSCSPFRVPTARLAAAQAVLLRRAEGPAK